MSLPIGPCADGAGAETQIGTCSNRPVSSCGTAWHGRVFARLPERHAPLDAASWTTVFRKSQRVLQPQISVADFPFQSPTEGRNGESRPSGRAWHAEKWYWSILSGAAEGTRTPDPIITNDVLYQLSYSGILLVQRFAARPVPDRVGVQGGGARIGRPREAGL